VTDKAPKFSLTEQDRRPPVELPKTEGLTPLDRDRAASIADEGGASAASVEAQKPPVKPAKSAKPAKRAAKPSQGTGPR